MVSYEAIQKPATCHIEKVANAEGNDGQPQWEIFCRWNFTSAKAQHPDRIWVDESLTPWGEDGKKAVGDWPVKILRDKVKLKADKTEFDGTHDWMWHWKIVTFLDSDATIDPPTVPASTTTAPQYSQQNVRQMSGSASGDIVPNAAAVGACQNQAHDLINDGVWPLPEGRTYDSWFRECRDWIYHRVNQSPVMPEHYCYAHNQERRLGNKGGWGHDVDGGYCLDGEVFQAKTQGLKDALISAGEAIYDDPDYEPDFGQPYDGEV